MFLFFALHQSRLIAFRRNIQRIDRQFKFWSNVEFPRLGKQVFDTKFHAKIDNIADVKKTVLWVNSSACQEY